MSPRAKSPDPRSATLSVRLTPGQKEAIAARARAAGIKSVSDFVLRAALEGPPAPAELVGTPVDPVVKEEVEREVAETRLEDPGAREAFLVRRSIALRGSGYTAPVARRMALEEWEAR